MESAKKSILVVEDETVVRELIRRILSEAGYDVALAADVKSAMESIHGRRPDMILLDLVLPGKSGLEVCRHVRRTPALKEIPILILSAKGAPADQMEGLQQGADDYLIKPFDPKDVKARVAFQFLKAERNKNA
ncbi:MAG: response regulator [Elusimicrobia bacterium]|nr:response regulator [Elusimicrobiota bacterium]